MAGHPCRGALTAVTERQYFEDKTGHVLSTQLQQALEFLMQAFDIMPDRKVSMEQEDSNPFVLYTDASTTCVDGRGLHIGLMLLEKGQH